MLIHAAEANICDACTAICTGMVAIDLWALDAMFPNRPWRVVSNAPEA